MINKYENMHIEFNIERAKTYLADLLIKTNS